MTLANGSLILSLGKSTCGDYKLIYLTHFLQTELLFTMLHNMELRKLSTSTNDPRWSHWLR